MASNEITGGLQLVCGRPTLALSSALVPQKLKNIKLQFLLLRNFSVAISVSPHVCFILVLILISMFLMHL